MNQDMVTAQAETRSRTVEDVSAGQLWRHFKGHIVRIIAVSTGSQDGKLVVVYRHIGNRHVWHRPFDMFMSQVDHERYPQVEQKYRFELISKGEISRNSKKPVETDSMM